MSNKWNILWYIFVPLIVGSIAGFSGYKLGIVINNPKFGMAVVGTGMVRNAFTGNNN